MSQVQPTIIHEEENIKEKVYCEFDKRRSDASANVKNQKQHVNKGAFEDQAAFMVHGQLAEAERKRHETERLISKLYEKPYFAHVRVEFEEDQYVGNYLLSDCEGLDEIVDIDDSSFLIPFKQDESRPISNALFRCYQSKKGRRITYNSLEKTLAFLPKLICDTDVENRVLRNVIQYYPKPETTQVTADEMLQSRLDENRNDPELRNIISTLQLLQFEIIGRDVDESFVVQGCAGSGKSQCLIHRLFYLRAVLAREGWDKVLLITPSKLFRHYSSKLMKRYQLTSIADCSIADLYRSLLNAYDERFRDRQYVFRLTEEYLPDGYLHAVYAEDNVLKVEKEIDSAIQKYVDAGCKALGISTPAPVTMLEINSIIERLDKEIERFDNREKELQSDLDYQGKRKDYENSLKEVETARRKLQRNKDELERNIKKQEVIDKTVKEIEELKADKRDWEERRKTRVDSAITELEDIGRKLDRGTDLRVPGRFARQLYVVRDMTEGESFQADEEEISYYNELIAFAENELQKLAGSKNVKNVISKCIKKQIELQEEIEIQNLEIEELVRKSEEFEVALRKAASDYDGQETKYALLRSDMQQARYFLGRIESTVFEREVWNALAPVKEQHGIETLFIEELDNGRRKESRILYKSDLLFYVNIYMKLHPQAELPDYRMICIDEGQDLHWADYSILRKIYPNAVFNVFGDEDQVLHEDCGINDWRFQTGISTVYSLTTNYRNTAAIVDFCNRRFGVKMDYVGNASETKEPIELHSEDEIRKLLKSNSPTVIVKDKDAYVELCGILKTSAEEFVFLDTDSDVPIEGSRECYSIFAAKGLEFPDVFVYARHMTKNQKVVACTRAMGGLYYYE